MIKKPLSRVIVGDRQTASDMSGQESRSGTEGCGVRLWLWESDDACRSGTGMVGKWRSIR